MGSLTSMRTDELDAKTAKPDATAALEAVVDRRLARLWRPLLLSAVSAMGGAGAATGLVAAGDDPPTAPAPAVVDTPVCECQATPGPSIVECRLAADFLRAAALSAGVQEPTLEAIATDLLGPPPPSQTR